MLIENTYSLWLELQTSHLENSCKVDHEIKIKRPKNNISNGRTNKDGDEEAKTRDIKVRITEVKHLVSLIQLNCLFSQIPVGPPSLDKGRHSSRVSFQKHKNIFFVYPHGR